MPENEIKAEEDISPSMNLEENTISDHGEQSEEPTKTKLQETIDFFRDLAIIFIVVIFVRTFIAAPFQISGSSMEESYHDGEFILVNKFSYADFGLAKVGNPARGDVVILRPHAANNKEYYIKRTIGLPGDTVKFEGGNVFLREAGKTDFVQLNEGYLSTANNGKTFLPMDIKETEFTVPAGQYFVMGDNRNNSSDSRSCFMSCSIPGSGHFVSRDNVVGKLFIDFGYINIFHEGGVSATGEWKWTHAPRFLATPKDWIYRELE
ncbi:MAG: signal peptidase I [Candidatus Gracilibacteria bacterium]|nr:signal peptidase I [Candidatus Gracilibacteria bacterium]